MKRLLFVPLLALSLSLFTSCVVEDDDGCNLDGVCEPNHNENALNCPEDCTCGDAICDDSETVTNCPEDCAAAPVCGDDICEGDEDEVNCPEDCAAGPICGDDVCEAGEDEVNCPEDCATGPICGDGVCEAGEDEVNCPGDCIALPVCGDDTCEADESYAECPEDCAHLICDQWAVWVEVDECEDTLIETCDVEDTTCLDFYSTMDPNVHATDLIEECAELLATADTSEECVDPIASTGENCAELLIADGAGGLLCTTI